MRLLADWPPLWFIQELFGLTKPIMLAGMNVAAGPELAAAVSNEGGLGVIGGVGVSPLRNLPPLVISRVDSERLLSIANTVDRRVPP
jgi:NAD(P)H-dependent flavin oxidoreductase YrpB (nitropropane dioxygenase family)